MFGALFPRRLGRLFGRSFFLGCYAPAAALAMHTPVLLFPGDRRSSLHTENLVHWLTSRGIVAGKPAFTVQWTGVFMLAPIRIFRWVYIYCPSHAHSFLRCLTIAVQ